MYACKQDKGLCTRMDGHYPFYYYSYISFNNIISIGTQKMYLKQWEKDDSTMNYCPTLTYQHSHWFFLCLTNWIFSFLRYVLSQFLQRHHGTQYQMPHDAELCYGSWLPFLLFHFQVMCPYAIILENMQLESEPPQPLRLNVINYAEYMPF